MIFIAVLIDFNFILFYYSGGIINISYLNFHLCAMPGVPATIPCVILSVSLSFFFPHSSDCSNFNQLTPEVKKGQKKKMEIQNSILRIATFLSITIHYFTKAYGVRMLMQVAVLYEQPPTSDRVLRTPYERHDYEPPLYLRVMSMRDAWNDDMLVQEPVASHEKIICSAICVRQSYLPIGTF